ncbi:hypothetical protein G5V59_20155 [Nocardioides sp. W3-2-3]|uniref:hypothetical protein n=1 Tax=Nocardioides convexus TaxID=2712224 RepID=UPI0024187F30|nr:hypothetical protein [Nocardioides convexus]NHA01375.1 hypothetical protein [Nocardioides convexus]
MVHLHGAASNGPLVFGSLEYLSAAASGGAAHKIFSDEWVDGVPTVVVGASLDDELDLARPLLGDAADSSRPSIIVKPTFTEFEEFRLRQAGLIPVRMEAKGFFQAVNDEWESTLSLIASAQVPGTEGLNPLALSFLRSFRKPADVTDRWHDLYAGDEPSWGDLRRGLDAPRAIQHIPKMADVKPTSGLRVLAFHGELSGTTTAEMRFLEDAVGSGFDVLEYCGDGMFDPRSIHWMAKQGARRLCCGSRESTSSLTPPASLEELCADSGTPVVLVSSIRSSRLPALQLHLGDALRPIRVSDRLAPREIATLLETLSRNNRLNVLLDLDEEERIEFLLRPTRRRSLTASLLSHGVGPSLPGMSRPTRR